VPKGLIKKWKLGGELGNASMCAYNYHCIL